MDRLSFLFEKKKLIIGVFLGRMTSHRRRLRTILGRLPVSRATRSSRTAGTVW